MAEYEPGDINVEVKQTPSGGIAVIQLLHGTEKVVLLRGQTMREVRSVLEAVESREGVIGSILTAGEKPIGGLDLAELSSMEQTGYCPLHTDIPPNGDLTLFMERMRKPIVAALNKTVAGGGCELAMACSQRVVGPKVSILQPEVNIGLIPGFGGTQRLIRLVSSRIAEQILFSGKRFTPEELNKTFWAKFVDASEDPVQVAMELIIGHGTGNPLLPLPHDKVFGPRISGSPGPDMSETAAEILQYVLRKSSGMTLPDGLAVEQEGFRRCVEKGDWKAHVTS